MQGVVFSCQILLFYEMSLPISICQVNNLME
jgi:hypothetical protein